MITLVHFKNFVDEINKENGRLYKQSVLRKYANDSVVKKYLQIAFDPFKVYGISSKKLHKQIADCPDCISLLTSVFGLFNYLESHNTGTTRDIYECQQMLDYAINDYPEVIDLLEALICKDLSIGCDVMLPLPPVS